ncbi:retrovirus-related pol polyprotein from transposon TNT 1-94 [Tanacetum coccineum]|uniref:Retrovirus-related pol polyprotein from transposon TNT 1-94 n=1 Tax=Tanacetum coccineum TaxID=301880 RepID=A0ABQ5BA36_9ASTR
MDLMHSTPSMYYDYDAHVKGELLVIMKNSQSVNLLIFISNTLIELFNDFGSDRDGILKRPTMYFNLWRYKVVRHSEIKGRMQTEMELTLEQTQQGVSYEVSMEILLEPTSNKLMVGDLCDSIRIKLVPGFYTSAGNPVKEILLKLNLPDHRSILTDSKVTPTKHGRMTKPYSSPRYIANCFNAGNLKMEVKFLRSKDEVPEFMIKFLKMIQVRLNVTVQNIRTDNGTEFVNQTLRAYYEDVEAVAIVCFTQNRSLIQKRHNKTPYELLHNKKPDLSYFHVFGDLCYLTNDSENLGKLKPKADIEIFVGYAPAKKAFRIYNMMTRLITETIYVDFDELTTMASEQSCSGPALHYLTPRTLSFRLVPNPPLPTPYVSANIMIFI